MWARAAAAMKLVHDRRGAGPPLVLVHGIGSRWQAWEPVLDRLAAEREVIVLDLPGFGASPPLPPGIPANVETLTQAVQAFVGALGLPRPHVAGNSLGGAIALELARRGAARSATALAPLGFGTSWEVVYAVASLRAWRRLARLLRPAAPAMVRCAPLRTVLFAQFFGRPSRLAADEALAAVDTLVQAPAFDATLSKTCRYRFGDAHELRVPITIAWGTRDRLLLPRQARRARRRLPAARHVWLYRCGHVPMSDDPEQVAAVLLAGSRD
jgi:pimeloyl-ACP methyl ester carboxylesterase